jgi:AraC-like DNA-binding protein
MHDVGARIARGGIVVGTIRVEIGPMGSKRQERSNAASPVNRFDSALAGESAWHSHAGGQFILVEAGVSHLATESGDWIVPTHRVGWVPPRVRHMSRPSRFGRGWVVIAPAKFVHSFPRQVCVLRASLLMTVVLGRITQLSPQDTATRALFWKVVAAELKNAQREPLELPMPSAPKLREAAQRVVEKPSIGLDLNKLAARAGMSRRSFTRHFRIETGQTYSKWRRAVIAHYALARIAAGDKVSSVAFDVGYESTSAFIAMFHRSYGASPGQFLSEHAEEYLRADQG